MRADDVLMEWVFNKISNNPELYGTDKGGHTLVSDYIYTIHNSAGRISEFVIKSIPSVYRLRRKILAKHREYDKRTETFRNGTSKNYDLKGQTYINYDSLTTSEAKELIDDLVEHIAGTKA